MSHIDPTGEVTQRDRRAVLVCLLLAALLAWVYLYSGAGMLHEMGGAAMPMSVGRWTAAHTLLVGAMWIVMMAAMMLPSALPVFVLHLVLTRRAAPGRVRAGAAAFGAGYLLVWSMFGAAATALQYALERAALLSPMMASTSQGLTGLLLISAGLYQWTPWKHACLRGCRSPLDWLMRYWRPGLDGAFRMGLRHGGTCVGCCWMLMLLLFAGGVMNFAWIIGIAALVLVEKLFPAGFWIARGAGLLLIAWGAMSMLG